MAGKAIGISMGFGYPGNYARTPDDITVARVLKSDSAAVPFGACLKLNDDNTVEAVGASFKAEDFAGIALRVVKNATNFFNQNTVAYQPGQVIDALTRGACTVVCNVGTPKAGGDVYVRVKANAGVPDGVVGGFEAQADAGDLAAGSNTYTVSTNFAAADEVEFEGQTFVADTDFEVGASAAASAADLAAALNANPAISAIYTANAVGAVITVTEKVAGGGNTPGDMEVASGGTGVITAGTATDSAAANNVLLPNVKWTTGAMDAENICEVTILTRVNP